MRRILSFLALVTCLSLPLVAQADTPSIADIVPVSATPTPTMTVTPTATPTALPTTTPSTIPVTGASTGLALFILFLFTGSVLLYAAAIISHRRPAASPVEEL